MKAFGHNFDFFVRGKAFIPGNSRYFVAAFALLASALCILQPLQAQEVYDTSGGPVVFEFKYNKGDTYRILSTVEEDVYVDHKMDHHATVINRIASEITDVDSEGSGVYSVEFMTSEDSVGSGEHSTFSWGEEYHSTYSCSPRGIYTIGDQFFMPMVRNVPVFPETPVNPGDSWQAQGEEAHDLRASFKLETPFIAPFTANYTYLGTVQQEENTFHVLRITYSTYTSTPSMDSRNLSYYYDYPVMMMGYSDELVYFDLQKGVIDHYTESFRIVMETAYGTRYENIGSAHSEMTEIVQMNTAENVDSIQQQVQDLGIENVTVSQGERGLTISLEDIKFRPDSAILMDSEKIKLQQIAEILMAYPENDILVVGHTALAGTEKVRMQLSQQRAETVASYLIENGVRDKQHIFTQGMGATQPIASNSTEEGKAKNRRVEIIILDK